MRQLAKEDSMSIWPAEVEAYLEEAFGQIEQIQNIKGVKVDGGCFRVCFPRVKLYLFQTFVLIDFLFGY